MKAFYSLLSIITLTACVNGVVVESDTVMVIPANTYENMLLDSNVYFTVRCSVGTSGYIDTYGQLEMYASMLPFEDVENLYSLADSHAKQECSV